MCYKFLEFKVVRTSTIYFNTLLCIYFFSLATKLYDTYCRRPSRQEEAYPHIHVGQGGVRAEELKTATEINWSMEYGSTGMFAVIDTRSTTIVRGESPPNQPFGADLYMGKCQKRVCLVLATALCVAIPCWSIYIQRERLHIHGHNAELYGSTK